MYHFLLLIKLYIDIPTDDSIAALINKHEFRTRDRQKELIPSDYNPIQVPSQRDNKSLLFEKYRAKDEAFTLRKDDKTQRNRIGFR